MRQTFKKHERLYGKTAVDKVFSEGKSFFSHPFIVYYLPLETEEYPPACSALFSVSKKKIRLSVGRNFIKRRLKEAFRKKKHLIYSAINAKNISLHVAFIYIHNEAYDYAFIEKSMWGVINQLIIKLTSIGKE
ncbi:MAG: ribonuclease P protein component [Bacteroidales bacterium]|jgi:ribonuclease P protein component|nr:ribonuclease P protein component [Bacteroidales bacterium]